MEPNFSHGALKINKEIFNQTIEQPLEFEYQLPDYCTGIFKMLQFKTVPHICSFRHSGDQFTIDGNTSIKLIYIDEEEGNLKSIHQNIPFSKTIKLDENLNNPCAFYDVKTNYCNCKIVSSKKIEIKGSLTMSLKIYDEIEQKIMQNLSEEETIKTGIHIKKDSFKTIAKQIFNSQQFKISEQIELENPIEELLDLKINAVENEHKIILNKIISKATVYATIIYCSNDKKNMLTKNLKIPVNQIIEMQGINENFMCNVEYEISSFTSNILQDGKILKIDADAIFKSYAFLSKKIEIISDVFSTKFKFKTTKSKINLINSEKTIKENIKLTENFPSINLKKIIDLSAEFSNLKIEQINNQIKFKADLKINAYGFSNDDTIENYEKVVPVSFKIQKIIKTNSDKIEFKLNITELKFLLDESKTLNLELDFQLNGIVNSSKKVVAIDKIEINEKEQKPKSNAALTLFYPQPNDNVWEIAKRFSACPKDIMEANGLTDDVITDEIMLIIPIN